MKCPQSTFPKIPTSLPKGNTIFFSHGIFSPVPECTLLFSMMFFLQRYPFSSLSAKILPVDPYLYSHPLNPEVNQSPIPVPSPYLAPIVPFVLHQYSPFINQPFSFLLISKKSISHCVEYIKRLLKEVLLGLYPL